MYGVVVIGMVLVVDALSLDVGTVVEVVVTVVGVVVIGMVLVVDALSLEVGSVVEVAEVHFELDHVIVGQSGQIGWPVIWAVVVDQLFVKLLP